MASASTIIVVGVLVGVLSSATQSLGLTLQRKASVACNGSLYRNSTWQLGLVLFLLANIVGSTVQIATLPLIILAPLQSCGLLFNSVAAHYILKERSSWRTPLATLFIIVGGMVIGVVGVSTTDDNSVTHSLSELLLLARQPLFLRWFVVTNVIVVLVLMWTMFSRLGLLAKGVIYGCCSGTWSAHSLLLAKSVSDIITHALIFKTSDLKRFNFYLLVVSFVSLSLTQLFLLNRGLRHLSTSILYPLVFCVYNLVNILNGVVFFHQDNTSLTHVIRIISPGVASLILGVVLLSQDQYFIAQREEGSSSQDASNRTSVLSYTSLRPRSVDLSSLQATSNIANDSDTFYVSLPQASKKDKYGSGASAKRTSKRVLSYEQEELLTQMV